MRGLSIFSSLVTLILATTAITGFILFYNGVVDTYGTGEQLSAATFNRTVEITDKVGALEAKLNETGSRPDFDPFGVFDLAAVFVFVFRDVVFTMPETMIDVVTGSNQELGQFAIPAILTTAVVAIIVIFFVFKIAAILLKKSGGQV